VATTRARWTTVLSRARRLAFAVTTARSADFAIDAKRGGVRPYSESYADHLVQKARKLAGLPSHVTLAACRHGGMTELGDAQITEQGIMALSGHRTPQAARVYVKRTERQRLAATAQRRRFLESEQERTIVGMALPKSGNRSATRMANPLNPLAGAGGLEPPHGGIKRRNAEMKY
jgi:integrase